MPEPATDSAVAEVRSPAAARSSPCSTFASELDPFTVGALDTGHLVMFRNVWRDGRRYVQGALIEREQFRVPARSSVRFARAVSPASATSASRIKARR